MPRGRMLNKKISIDDKVNSLSIKSILIFTWLIPHLDCEGRIMAVSEKIKYEIFPINKHMLISDISKALTEMQDKGLICLYGENNVYCQFLGFEKNQKIDKDREAQSMIPTPTHEQLTSNSRVTPQELTSYSCANVNSEVEVKVKSKGNVHYSFDEVYSQYPNKVGRKKAEVYFKSSVNCEKDFSDIKRALENYLKSERVKKGFVQNAGTWFNNWKDWVDYTDTPKREVKIID